MTSHTASLRLVLLALLALSVASCGGDDVPPVDTDSGAPDAAPQDAAPSDAARPDAALDDAGARDAGDVDAFGCPDSDGDGHADAACGGDDCDDTDVSRYPGATEVCNGGVDDDCNGLADIADGVCVPCPTGYTGIDGSCTDVDECVVGGFCGLGSTACINVPGSFVCTCGVGYFASTPAGSLCENVDECAAAMNPCGVGTCTDNAGSYACSCPAGYRLAGAPVLTCVDIDECAENTDQCTDAAPTPVCVNSGGSYACVCPTGYEGSGRVGVGCTNVDECARGTADCDPLAACADTVGSFTCTCPAGYLGTAHGAGGCV